MLDIQSKLFLKISGRNESKKTSTFAFLSLRFDVKQGEGSEKRRDDSLSVFNLRIFITMSVAVTRHKTYISQSPP